MAPLHIKLTLVHVSVMSKKIFLYISVWTRQSEWELKSCSGESKDKERHRCGSAITGCSCKLGHSGVFDEDTFAGLHVKIRELPWPEKLRLLLGLLMLFFSSEPTKGINSRLLTAFRMKTAIVVGAFLGKFLQSDPFVKKEIADSSPPESPFKDQVLRLGSFSNFFF